MSFTLLLFLVTMCTVLGDNGAQGARESQEFLMKWLKLIERVSQKDSSLVHDRLRQMVHDRFVIFTPVNNNKLNKFTLDFKLESLSTVGVDPKKDETFERKLPAHHSDDQRPRGFKLSHKKYEILQRKLPAHHSDDHRPRGFKLCSGSSKTCTFYNLVTKTVDCLNELYELRQYGQIVLLKRVFRALQKSDTVSLFAAVQDYGVPVTVTSNVNIANCFLQQMALNPEYTSKTVARNMNSCLISKFKLLQPNPKPLIHKLRLHLKHGDSASLFSSLLSENVPVTIANNVRILNCYLESVNRQRTSNP